ncbi:MAG TPA: tetratricopeptide repeat protein [Clostridia bacterium]
MSIWDILGIEKTYEITEIKKAYAKMLKVYHPEDDPEGFMRLREAYETAVRQVKQIRPPANLERFNSNIKLNEETTQDEKVFNGNDSENVKPPFYENAPEERIRRANLNNHDYMQKLVLLYGDIFKRRNVKCWKDFFIELTLIQTEDLSIRGASFFNKNCDLPHEVWALLDELLWLSDNRKFKWKELVKHDFGLPFDYFEEDIHCDYAKYSCLRFIAFEEFLQGNYELCIDKAQKAFQIYERDPSLHRLKGISHYMRGEYEKAVEAFSKAIDINSKDVDSLSYRGSAYFKKKDFLNAQKDFEAASKINPESIYFKKKIIKCLYEQKEYKKTIKILKKINRREMQDFELDMIAGILIIPTPSEKFKEQLVKAKGIIKNLIKNSSFQFVVQCITGLIIFPVTMIVVFKLAVLIPFALAIFAVWCIYKVVKVFFEK